MPKLNMPDRQIGMCNLVDLLSEADAVDFSEGKEAYRRYNEMLKRVYNAYPHWGFHNVVAAFCALSPNNDYVGNLRSLITLMRYSHEGVSLDRIKVSTYNHCRDRAANYLAGEEFATDKRGLKIKSFYYNILRPEDTNWVTIDGHMVAAFCGDSTMTMKDAQIGRYQYKVIADCTFKLAKAMRLRPNQVQAIIWFARKRLYRIKYDGDYDMFKDASDNWRILLPLEELQSYTLSDPYGDPEQVVSSSEESWQPGLLSEI